LSAFSYLKRWILKTPREIPTSFFLHKKQKYWIHDFSLSAAFHFDINA
jgi:hypothetical protein